MEPRRVWRFHFLPQRLAAISRYPFSKTPSTTRLCSSSRLVTLAARNKVRTKWAARFEERILRAPALFAFSLNSGRGECAQFPAVGQPNCLERNGFLQLEPLKSRRLGAQPASLFPIDMRRTALIRAESKQ